jgi:hypothetical protein
MPSTTRSSTASSNTHTSNSKPSICSGKGKGKGGPKGKESKKVATSVASTPPKSELIASTPKSIFATSSLAPLDAFALDSDISLLDLPPLATNSIVDEPPNPARTPMSHTTIKRGRKKGSKNKKTVQDEGMSSPVIVIKDGDKEMAATTTTTTTAPKQKRKYTKRSTSGTSIYVDDTFVGGDSGDSVESISAAAYTSAGLNHVPETVLNL